MDGALPLTGQRVVVTRAAHQAAATADAFRQAGARVELLPLLELGPPPDPKPLHRAAAELGSYRWLAFTSANAVQAFLPYLTAPLPPGLSVAIVGPATAHAARQAGLRPDLIATTPRGEGLAEDLGQRLSAGQAVLIPLAEDARPQLAAGLRAAGAKVHSVIAYSKRMPKEAPERFQEVFGDGPLGWVTFTSPRIVRHFASLAAEAWNERRGTLRALSIGPVTSRELRRQGVEPAAEARLPGSAGLVQALVESLAASIANPPRGG